MEKGKLITLGDQYPASRLFSNSPSSCQASSLSKNKQTSGLKAYNQNDHYDHLHNYQPIQFFKKPLQKEQYIFLFFSTAIDTGYMESKIKSFQQKAEPSSKLTIPSIYLLLEEYEKIFRRSYSQELKFYITAAFWDQKLANIGSLPQWNWQIQQEIRRSYNHNELYIDQLRDQQIQQAGIDMGQKKQEKQTLPLRPYLLTHQLVQLIQSIQHQYYREKITFDQLTQKCKQENTDKDLIQMIEEIATDIFGQFDNQKLGYIFFSKFYAHFLINNNEHEAPPSTTQLYKVLNNIHEYDKNKNVMLPSNICEKSPHMSLENIMQLFLRVSPLSQLAGSLSQSETFKSIKIFLQKYQELKKGVQKRSEQGDRKRIEKRNEKLEILATMEYIRQAATTIIENKIRTNQSLNIETEYMTQKKGQIYHQNNDQTQIKVRYPGSSILKSGIRPQHSQKRLQSELNQMYMNNLGSTSQSKIYNAGLKIDNYSARSPSSFNFSNTDNEQKKHGSWPLTPAQNQLNQANLSKKVQNEKQRDCYDKELHQRIENEMKIIQLEKLKNRVKYFNVIYQ